MEENREKSYAEIFAEEQAELASEAKGPGARVPDAVKQVRRDRNKRARKARRKARG
jgi:hypothetical protein